MVAVTILQACWPSLVQVTNAGQNAGRCKRRPRASLDCTKFVAADLLTLVLRKHDSHSRRRRAWAADPAILAAKDGQSCPALLKPPSRFVLAALPAKLLPDRPLAKKVDLREALFDILAVANKGHFRAAIGTRRHLANAFPDSNKGTGAHAISTVRPD